MVFTLALSFTAVGQMKKQFVIENTPACEEVDLTLRSGNSNCSIRPSQYSDILTVYSNLDPSQYSQNFRKEINGKICDVLFSIEDVKGDLFGNAISYNVFGNQVRADAENFWKMYLSDGIPYELEMNYGVGNADIDLSGLAIKRVKISSGSANVRIGYPGGLENKVEMDTFLIKVDWGSVEVRSMNSARARNVIADVGFGTMVLDFSDRPFGQNTVKGSVGAGNLIIILPERDTPLLLKVSDSWLCSVKVPYYLQRIDTNTFASSTYSKSSNKALSFDLDVSMGNIIFRQGR